MSYLKEAFHKDGRPFANFPTYNVHDDISDKVIGQIQTVKSMGMGIDQNKAESGEWIAWVGENTHKVHEDRPMKRHPSRDAALMCIEVETNG